MEPDSQLIEILAAFCGACSFAMIRPKDSIKTSLPCIIVGVSFGAFVAPLLTEVSGRDTHACHTAIAFGGGLVGMPASKAILQWTESSMISLLNFFLSKVTGKDIKDGSNNPNGD